MDIQLSDRSKAARVGEPESTVTEGDGTPSISPPTAITEPDPKAVLRGRVQFASLCFTLYLAGWNDGTTGPLIPRMQEVYHVGFTVVSLVFIANCVGFIAGAMANVKLTEKLGFGKVIVLGSVAQVIGYALQAPAPPFPLFVIAYAFNGIGISLQDAQANGYVACLKDSPATKMGILHAVYGAGALCAPIVATQFYSMPHWNFHYLVSLAISVLNTVSLLAVFKLKNQDECFREAGQAPNESGTSESSHYKQILRLKPLHLLAFFSLLYVGVEVTIGGWIVTYINDLRHGGHSSGYISSGFFGGLMFGRLALLWVNHKVGERTVLFIYGLLAVGLELVIWLVPSLIGDAVAISLVGVLLGPIYPIVMNHAGRVLPRWLITGAIGWIAGFGQAGSAVFPFMTGALASKFGIRSLQPLLVAMMGTMMGVWALVPGSPKRPD